MSRIIRKYKVWDEDKLILRDATSKEVSDAIGVSTTVVYRYATKEYGLKGYYKKRYKIRFDDETDKGGKQQVEIEHKEFVQRFGMQNLKDWENIQEAARLLRNPPEKIEREMIQIEFTPRKGKIRLRK